VAGKLLAHRTQHTEALLVTRFVAIDVLGFVEHEFEGDVFVPIAAGVKPEGVQTLRM